MKKSLSVILSLVLLVSSLVIPMTVSADGTLTADEAYAQLNAAVDGLELDIEAARQNGLLVETAYPVGTQVSGGSGDTNVITDANDDTIAIADTENTLAPKIGSKYVDVTGNNATTAANWGLKNDALHTLRYQYDIGNLSSISGQFPLKDIGYIVLYVKTNRPFKFGMSVINNYKTPRIVDGLDISATADGNYEPIIINMSKIDWTNDESFQGAYISNNINWGYFPCVESMTDAENNTITATDGIAFGTLLCVPVDTAVRDFKYDLSGTVPAKKYYKLSGDMIAAAEKITNDDGRYTEKSFADLQTAVENAKASYLASADISEIKALLSAELENAGIVEEVWLPKWVKDEATNSWNSPDNVFNPADNTADEIVRKYATDFGSCVAKLDSTHKILSITADGANENGANSNPINVSDYSDMWMYVYNNTETAITPDQFIVVSTGSTNHYSVVSNVGSLSAGILTRIDVDSLLIVANNNQTVGDTWNTNRIQLKIQVFHPAQHTTVPYSV